MLAAPPQQQTATRRIAGAAGLTYVIGSGVENMDVLIAPTPDSPAAEIRAFYADQALGIVTTATGAVALLAYCVLAVALFRLTAGGAAGARPWAVAGLTGGLAGPLLAVVGLVASAILVGGGEGRSDDAVRSLFGTYVDARLVSGLFIALFLGGFGVATLRSRALPAPLAIAACGLAVPPLLGPVAAQLGSDALRVVATVAFSAQALWIFAASLWLALDGGAIARADFVRRAAFLVLVIAAGGVGLAMLAAPGATGRFFAWELTPEPLAAFAGGVYVGSAAVYALALTRPWPEVRSLVVGAIVLSVSVFVVTLVHLDVFDLDRLQAWAWLVLFAGFGVITIGLLAAGGPPEEARAGRLQPWSRALLGAVALAGGGLAIALWADPTGLSEASPFTLPPLGGRFAGSWIALLSVLLGWAALRDRADEARLAAVALVALPAGALIAAARTSGDLDGAGAGYAIALVLLAACGLAVLASLRGAAVSPSSGRP